MGDTNTIYTTENLDKLYLEYYSRTNLSVPNIPRREIAFSYWKGLPPQDRHRYFESDNQLNEFVRKVPRSAVFASAAYYLDPMAREFSKKGLKKFDLIFDIDGDAIEGDYFEMITEMCKHGKSLIDDFLMEDFGIPLEDLRIEFSGKKGLHVTVLSEEHKQLSQESRRQLFYYIEGSQVDKAVLFPERKGYVVAMPNAKGWRKYARKTIMSLLAQTEGKTQEEVKEIVVSWGLPKIRAKKISDLLTRPKIRQAVLEGRLSALTGKGEKTLSDLMKTVTKQHNLGLGGCLDRKPTVDKHRIFRVPNSLHPKSGFPCLEISYDDLSNPTAIFDKIKEAVGTDLVTIVLSEPVVVETDRIHRFEVGEHTLPRYLAIASLSKICYK